MNKIILVLLMYTSFIGFYSCNKNAGYDKVEPSAADRFPEDAVYSVTFIKEFLDKQDKLLLKEVDNGQDQKVEMEFQTKTSTILIHTYQNGEKIQEEILRYKLNDDKKLINLYFPYEEVGDEQILTMKDLKIVRNTKGIQLQFDYNQSQIAEPDDDDFMYDYENDLWAYRVKGYFELIKK